MISVALGDGPRRKRRRFASLLSQLVQVIAAEVGQSARRTIEEDIADHAVYRAEDQVARRLFRKQYLELDDGQRLEVHSSVSDSDAVIDRAILDAEQQYSNDQDLEAPAELSAWPAELAAVTTPHVVHGDIDTGCWATTTLTMQGRPPMPLQSPKIRAIGMRFREDALNKHIEACLIQALIAEVSERVRMHTPARPRR